MKRTAMMIIPILIKLIPYEELKKLVINLLRKIAQKTDNSIDDKLVDNLEKHLNLQDCQCTNSNCTICTHEKDTKFYSKEFIENLKISEGFISKVYKCPAGKLTVGYGRNLEDNGITKDEAEALMFNDIEKVENLLNEKLTWFKDLDNTRREVLIDMAFNMGVFGLLKFKNTLKYIEEKEYGIASQEMLNSKWSQQVGDRAIKLSNVMALGRW